MPTKVVALVSVMEGAEEAFLAAARECVVHSRAEPGVLRYELWREDEGERRFVLDELYVDDDAMATHMAADHHQAFAATAKDLISASTSIMMLRAVNVGER